MMEERITSKHRFPIVQLAPFYPILYPMLKAAFPNCLWSGPLSSRNVALTFDDGPHPDYTPELLRVLAKYGVRASFFFLGSQVERYPDLTREVYRQGHWIGLHGYYHRSFPFLAPDNLKQSLFKTQEIISRVCQLEPERVRDVRPPNGLFTPKILARLRQQNYRVVMWSVVPEDWVLPGIEVVTSRVMDNIHNGALIVLHDGYCGGRDVARTSAGLIPRLWQQGYSFVSINDLWQMHDI